MNKAAFMEYIDAENSVLQWATHAKTLASELIVQQFPVGTIIRERTTGKKYSVLAHELSRREGQTVALCKSVTISKGVPRKMLLKDILSDFAMVNPLTGENMD